MLGNVINNSCMGASNSLMTALFFLFWYGTVDAQLGAVICTNDIESVSYYNINFYSM